MKKIIIILVLISFYGCNLYLSEIKAYSASETNLVTNIDKNLLERTWYLTKTNAPQIDGKVDQDGTLTFSKDGTFTHTSSLSAASKGTYEIFDTYYFKLIYNFDDKWYKKLEVKYYITKLDSKNLICKGLFVTGYKESKSSNMYTYEYRSSK